MPAPIAFTYCVDVRREIDGLSGESVGHGGKTAGITYDGLEVVVARETSVSLTQQQTIEYPHFRVSQRLSMLHQESEYNRVGVWQERIWDLNRNGCNSSITT